MPQAEHVACVKGCHPAFSPVALVMRAACVLSLFLAGAQSSKHHCLAFVKVQAIAQRVLNLWQGFL